MRRRECWTSWRKDTASKRTKREGYTTNDDNDPAQARVRAMADAANRIFAGMDMAEVCTAITLVVASNIVACSDNRKNWDDVIAGFAGNVREMLKDDEIVAFIKRSIQPTTTGHA
jgi:hypothetical protein